MILQGHAFWPANRHPGSNYQQPATLSGNYTRIFGFLAPDTGTMYELQYWMFASYYPYALTASVYTVGNDGLPNTLLSQKAMSIDRYGPWNILSEPISVTRGKRYYVMIEQSDPTGSVSIDASPSDGWDFFGHYTHITQIWVWNGSDLVSGSTTYKLHWQCRIGDCYYGSTNPVMTDTTGVWMGNAFRLPKPVKLIGFSMHEMSGAGINPGPMKVRLFELPEYSWAPLDIDTYLEEVSETSAVGLQRAGYETHYVGFFSKIYTLQSFALLMNNRVPGVKDTAHRVSARMEMYNPVFRKIRGRYMRSCIYSWLGWRVYIGYSDGTIGVHYCNLFVVPYDLNVNSVAEAVPYMVMM